MGTNAIYTILYMFKTMLSYSEMQDAGMYSLLQLIVQFCMVFVYKGCLPASFLIKGRRKANFLDLLSGFSSPPRFLSERRCNILHFPRFFPPDLLSGFSFPPRFLSERRRRNFLHLFTGFFFPGFVIGVVFPASFFGQGEGRQTPYTSQRNMILFSRDVYPVAL